MDGYLEKFSFASKLTRPDTYTLSYLRYDNGGVWDYNKAAHDQGSNSNWSIRKNSSEEKEQWKFRKCQSQGVKKFGDVEELFKQHMWAILEKNILQNLGLLWEQESCRQEKDTRYVDRIL